MKRMIMIVLVCVVVSVATPAMADNTLKVRVLRTEGPRSMARSVLVFEVTNESDYFVSHILFNVDVYDGQGRFRAHEADVHGRNLGPHESLTIEAEFQNVNASDMRFWNIILKEADILDDNKNTRDLTASFELRGEAKNLPPNLYVAHPDRYPDYGSTLFADCSVFVKALNTGEIDDSAIARCSGSIDGVLISRNDLFMSGQRERFFCIPPNVTGAEVINVVVNYLRGHLDLLDKEPGVFLATRAIKNRWPCPEKPKKPGKVYGPTNSSGLPYSAQDVFNSCKAWVDFSDGIIKPGVGIEWFGVTFCGTYIDGVTSGLIKPGLICLPSGTAKSQVVHVVVEYLGKHSGDLNKRAAFPVTKALMDAFPCPKKLGR